MVYGELGRFPIDVAIKTRMIGYWGKIVTGKQLKHARSMYQFLLKQYTENKFESPRLSESHNILNNCDLGNLFYVKTPNFSVKWLQRMSQEACKISLYKPARQNFNRKIFAFCTNRSKLTLNLKIP